VKARHVGHVLNTGVHATGSCNDEADQVSSL
jgi:hypothetical protein